MSYPLKVLIERLPRKRVKRTNFVLPFSRDLFESEADTLLPKSRGVAGRLGDSRNTTLSGQITLTAWGSGNNGGPSPEADRESASDGLTTFRRACRSTAKNRPTFNSRRVFLLFSFRPGSPLTTAELCVWRWRCNGRSLRSINEQADTIHDEALLKRGWLSSFFFRCLVRASRHPTRLHSQPP